MLAWVFFTVIFFASCGGKNTSSNVETPGTDKDVKSKRLEVGAALLQSRSPLKKINVYLDGFHFCNGIINAQMEAHHCVLQIKGDVYQQSFMTVTARAQKS